MISSHGLPSNDWHTEDIAPRSAVRIPSAVSRPIWRPGWEFMDISWWNQGTIWRFFRRSCGFFRRCAQLKSTEYDFGFDSWRIQPRHAHSCHGGNGIVMKPLLDKPTYRKHSKHTGEWMNLELASRWWHGSFWNAWRLAWFNRLTSKQSTTTPSSKVHFKKSQESNEV